jgi:hypothetical protein
MPDMPTLLVLMVLAGLGLAWWSSARRAADHARELGRRACDTAGVQWLDQNVHAHGWRVHRRGDGWLGVERRYRFDYSRDGHDRHVGELVLREGRLVGFSGPDSATRVVPFGGPGTPPHQLH